MILLFALFPSHRMLSSTILWSTSHNTCNVERKGSSKMKNSSGGYCYALCDANWKNSSKIIPQLYV